MRLSLISGSPSQGFSKYCEVFKPRTTLCLNPVLGWKPELACMCGMPGRDFWDGTQNSSDPNHTIIFKPARNQRLSLQRKILRVGVFGVEMHQKLLLERNAQQDPKW